ncbi:hypothetical protein CFIMG_003334RAa [Ceratocystis fimbriata CBS 114723]|uniref:Pre-mRNA splicing factor CLF1 n=1 Tax=Ceratocystis fimbriata CBS 114723 TaxID=1035309 RepID=A0A2C5WY93_9PEZI|nr:hypothetical protein CFIMG_003334RAa [Ceratocystis fimbriata CBS 114723]
MSYKSSPISLAGACTAIHDNVLYAYSANGFVKLPLKNGGEWTKLASGEAVSDATCIGAEATDASKSALYIMGGTSTNGAYNGIQRYVYSTGAWETLSTTDPVLKNRKGMSAAYIPATDSFITYGGRTDGTYGVDSQTFSIKASAPYTVTSAVNPFSYTLQTPIMLGWVDGEVLLAGGSTTNLDLIIYNAGTNTWRQSGGSLADPVAKITNKGYLQKGDDGSKSLYTFDLAQSPVRVTRSVIVDATGGFVTKSNTIVAARQLSSANWPAYNSTFAPASASGEVYSAAANSDGHVFFLTSDASNPVSAFDATQNSWVDVDSELASQSVLIADVSSSTTLGTSTTTSTTSSGSTSATTSASKTTSSSSITSSVSSRTSGASTTNSSLSATASSTELGAASSEPSKGGLSSNDVLGIVLGSILGSILLLVGILFFIKKARRRKGYTGEKNRPHNEFSNAEKNVGMGMASEQFVDSIGGGPRPRNNTDSVGSLAIFGGVSASAAGRSASPAFSAGGGNAKNLRRKPSDPQSNNIAKNLKSTISKPIMANDSSLMAGGKDRISINTPGRSPPLPPGSQPALAPERHVMDDATRRSSGWNKYWSQGSGALNALSYGNGHNDDDGATSHYPSTYSAVDNINRRTQDSATVPPLIMPPEGRPELNRVASGSPTVSHYAKYATAQAQVAAIERPVSDAQSAYSSGVAPSVQEAWGPISQQKAWGADSVYGAHGHNVAGGIAHEDSQNQDPRLAMTTQSSDMSWLNLGEYKRANP